MLFSGHIGGLLILYYYAHDKNHDILFYYLFLVIIFTFFVLWYSGGHFFNDLFFGLIAAHVSDFLGRKYLLGFVLWFLKIYC